MPNIAGTISQYKDCYVSGTVTKLAGVTANAAETIGWAVDYARGEIQRITGIGGTLTNTVLTTGLTNPRAIALSPDELKLYVLQYNGVMLSVDVTTGVATSIGTLAALSSTWLSMRIGQDGYLYCASENVKAIHRYDITTNTAALFLYLPYIAKSLEISSDGLYLYTFLTPGDDSAVLCKIIISQGRFEIVAGTGAVATTNGEAFLVAAFAAVSGIACASATLLYTGQGLYGNSVMRTIDAGTVSGVSVGSGYCGGTAGSSMWMLRTSNKILCTNGSTAVAVIV